ncbi:defensin-1-like [Malania oleifera]|uniref:defensin-1-like n=1 Tax=Malania oleifera TaxID=397392 RepID=UPI0025AE5B74|nr:defensin-1-like [Malania oleifera]
MERKSLGLFVLLLIAFATQDQMVVPAEGKTCEAPSGKFHGVCFLEKNCWDVCTKKEHLLAGFCKGNMCYCRRNC